MHWSNKRRGAPSPWISLFMILFLFITGPFKIIKMLTEAAAEEGKMVCFSRQSISAAVCRLHLTGNDSSFLGADLGHVLLIAVYVKVWHGGSS